jgi:hypothetical protein
MCALCEGKAPRFSWDRRLCEPQSRSGRGDEEENPYQELNPGRSTCSLVTLLTKLSQLLEEEEEEKEEEEIWFCSGIN